jgi:HSP20 family protein
MLGWSIGMVTPIVKLAKNARRCEVSVDLPEFKPGDVRVYVSKDVLIIHGQKKEAPSPFVAYLFAMEGCPGQFEYRLPLQRSIDLALVSASFTSGLLTVRVPATDKSMNAEGAIEIKSK